MFIKKNIYMYFNWFVGYWYQNFNFFIRLFQVSEECNILRLNLSEAQHECDQAKQERTALHVKVGSLEETIKVSNNYQS